MSTTENATVAEPEIAAITITTTTDPRYDAVTYRQVTFEARIVSITERIQPAVTVGSPDLRVFPHGIEVAAPVTYVTVTIAATANRELVLPEVAAYQLAAVEGDVAHGSYRTWADPQGVHTEWEQIRPVAHRIVGVVIAKVDRILDRTLERLAELRSAADHFRGGLARVEAERDDLIRAALESELPGPVIAASSGLSKQRIYQIRDRTR